MTKVPVMVLPTLMAILASLQVDGECSDPSSSAPLPKTIPELGGSVEGNVERDKERLARARAKDDRKAQRRLKEREHLQRLADAKKRKT